MQKKFDQIFLTTYAFQPLIVRITYQKPLGGRHHGVHLGIPQKSDDGEADVPNLHCFPHAQIILLPVTDGDVDLSASDFVDHTVLQIHQVIESFALNADTVILGVVRQRIPTQNHGAVLQIQKAQGLIVPHLLLFAGKLDKGRLIERSGMHLQEVRCPGRFHQRIHRTQ